MHGAPLRTVECHHAGAVLGDHEGLAAGESAEESGLHAIGLADLVVVVTQQRERQVVLELELLVRVDGAVGDADHRRASSLWSARSVRVRRVRAGEHARTRANAAPRARVRARARAHEWHQARGEPARTLNSPMASRKAPASLVQPGLPSDG